MNQLEMRKAVTEDLPALTRIYNQAIEAGYCTCDTLPFSPKEREGWLMEHQDRRFPLITFLWEGEICGYAYLSPYRSGRNAVAQTAEISYYLDFAFHGKGIGSEMLKYMLAQAQELGFAHLIAILLDSNTPSIGLLKKYGFSEWGRLPKIAHFGSRQVDHLYYGHHL